jgi:hypothetical protein
VYRPDESKNAEAFVAAYGKMNLLTALSATMMSLQEKLAYMINNPVKAGLCDDGWKYPGWYFQTES